MLQVLHNATPQLRKAIIHNLSKEALYCICDCCYNLLKGNLQLSAKDKKRLVPHRGTLRQLASKGVSLKNKKHLLIQKGGLVSALIAPLLGVAASLIAEWIQQ